MLRQRCRWGCGKRSCWRGSERSYWYDYIIYPSIDTISTFSCSPFILSNILFPTAKNSNTVGAILPGMDAGDGAAAGAAVGALSGGVGGLRGRRHR